MGCCAQRCDPRLTEQASWVQRMQKALVQMNIQLTEVISDVTGQAIIGDIVSGQRDARVLARHRQPAHPGQRARHRASADAGHSPSQEQKCLTLSNRSKSVGRWDT